jgi:predicted AAA+ superfamily ATPase
MYRTTLEELKKWKNAPNRKPLIVYGARQVGKTWLMQEFGRQNYKKVAYISCQDNPRMQQLFDEGFNIPRIIQSLRMESEIDIDQETLIILDEVQEAPKAITSLKYFYENAPQYHIMVAGSLLGIAIHPGISFPVGKVDMITLQPMTFFEFFNAVEGNEKMLELLTAKKPDFQMIKVFKSKFIDVLKLYYFIGGMP